MRRFKLAKSVSGRSWRGVNQSELFGTLMDGLEATLPGANEAVQEVYALVRGEIRPTLAESDCLLPHHEVSDAGAVVLSKAGLVAATARLATTEDLTDEEKASAKAHLLRHYHEAELPPPESLTGEMAAIIAQICGEMAVEDIPISPAVDVDALRDGDEDPLEVVVEIPAGKSKRGWDYLPRALQDIVDVVNAEGLPGYEGHQSASNVDWEFRTPVTHWTGAIWQDGSAYFRGLIDKGAADLKRWIRGGTVKTVSIWGQPNLAYEGGVTKVIGYNPLSIDWTPPRRAGMPTRIVAMGEIDSTLGGEMDGSYEDIREEVLDAIRAHMDVGRDGWIYIERTFPNYVIAVAENKGRSAYYKFDYAIDGDKVVIGKPEEVTMRRIYEPTQSGEMDTGGAGRMNWKELIAKLKAMLDSKEVTPGQVIGEIGLTPEAVAGEMKEIEAAMNAAKTLEQVSEALGVSGEIDVVEVAKAAAEAKVAQARLAQETMVAEVLGEKVTGEMAQALIRRMLIVPVDATKEQVVGEIDKLLADETVKGALSKLHIDQPAALRGLSHGDETAPQYVRTKRQSI